MNNTITAGDYNFRKGYQSYENLDRPMTYHQRKALENLIYNRIDNIKEVQRRLSEIESFNYVDAEDMLQHMKYSAMR